MRTAVVVIALAGCYHRIGDAPCSVSCETNADCAGRASCTNGVCGVCTDASAGSDAPLSDGLLCYGHLGITLCTSMAAPGTVTPPTAIDTDAGLGCTPLTNGGQAICLVSGTNVFITAPTRATGSVPLVVFATNTISIGAGASIDVSSSVSKVEVGAGADFQMCPTINASGGGAGAGGSFRAGFELGGNGGNGGTLGLTDAGATAVPGPSPVTLVRGGCAGGTGGFAGQGAGFGGHSGGAVYLLAGNSIDILGLVNASGAGGEGGAGLTAAAGGGGGGGSGGLIVLDASLVKVTASGSFASLFAEGGGGGGGGVAAAAVVGPGGPGGDPDPTAPTVAASGGAGADSASGPGGAGSVADMPGDAGLSSSQTSGKYNGGGGGGGGPGYIYAYGTFTMLGNPIIAPTADYH